MINHRIASVAAFMTLLAVLWFGNNSYATELASDDAPVPSIAEMQIEDVHLPSIIEMEEVPISEFERNMKLVFNVGREIGNPEVLQAILLIESQGLRANAIGGKNLPPKKRSYGLMQVQLVAAQSILARYPELLDAYFPDRQIKTISDKEIIALLLDNRKANVRIAAYHFRLYFQLLNGNLTKTVCAYNVGIGAVERISNYATTSYVTNVKTKIKTIVKAFNIEHGLSLTQ